MTNRAKYCVANFKMHKTALEVLLYIEKLWHLGTDGLDNETVILCPSITSMASLMDQRQSYHDNVRYGSVNRARTLIGKGYPSLCAQNMHYEVEGAFTGEVSAKMVKDIGASYVLLGHSERRQYFNETNEDINLKMIAALTGGGTVKDKLRPILCIGESLEERKANLVETTLKKQLSESFKNVEFLNRSKATSLIKYIQDGVIIAYEPIWAIGTGETATSKIITETHQMIRKILNDIGFDGQKISILYGGSVNRNNAKELIALEDVDGFLIGGASLDVEHFSDIYNFF